MNEEIGGFDERMKDKEPGVGRGTSCREKALLLAVVAAFTWETPPVFAGGNIGAGKAIFEADCASCHGPGGEGNGPAARGMSPPPPDFTDPNFWAGKTDSFLEHVIVNGLDRMPSWEETLSPGKIEEVLSYIKTFKK